MRVTHTGFLTAIVVVGAAGAIVQPQTPASPAFEVASIKVNRSGQNWSTFGNSPGGRLTVINATLRDLLRLVYQVEDHQIEGAPGWTESERYDIQAKAEHDLPPLAAPMPGQPPSPAFLMVRSLLIDRFALAVRVETRTAPVYHLVVVRADRKPGPQLSISDVDCGAYRAARRAAAAAASPPPVGAPPPPPPPPPPGDRVTCGMNSRTGTIAGGAMPLDMLAHSLARVVHRPVLNRTALDGNYDFTLEFRPDQAPPGAAISDAAVERPSIFTALQEELGLKLEPAQGPVEFVVIDHVEHPTEN
jgi:uncharacterized protein (TIGR03435 family)